MIPVRISLIRDIWRTAASKEGIGGPCSIPHSSSYSLVLYRCTRGNCLLIFHSFDLIYFSPTSP